ncbi:uncharacterized protein LOC131671433 [Phymastichus coffea]|uniref:uncharacterized protein LOC131671433 n=1 Tax=Phymastichus coffea TaxID=108790 RepID=UPI00273B74B1|nr:uncharacterized protein LOC131671433 [Phymastichus coffea]
MLLGFAEDYRKIVVNVEHELIITQSRTDTNAVIVESTAERQKIKLLNYIGKDRPITMRFRSWKLYVCPKLPVTLRCIWTVKTSIQLEKPHFVVLAFQMKRKYKKSINANEFDHCSISNVKLFLISQYYPYGNVNLNINQNECAILDDMFANFRNSYYSKDVETVLNKNNFIKKVPLVVCVCRGYPYRLRNSG